MKPGGAIPRGVAVLSLGLALVVPLTAQQRLYVLEPDGNYHPVLKVSRDRPLVMEQGKFVAAHGTRYALRSVEEYLP